MKILHVSTLDIAGGAARGAYWIHRAMREMGADSWMFVSDKRSRDDSVAVCPAEMNWKETIRIRTELDDQRLALYPKHEAVYFSPASFAPGMAVEAINRLEADIINLHWVAGGFLMPEDIPHLRGKIVWTLRDMWPFTGGCHYSEGCARYLNQCGQCPILGSDQEEDITRDLWVRKEKSWRDVPIQLVAVSRWMAERATASQLFASREVEVIHNGLPLEEFSPCDKAEARQRLGLSPHKIMILFGALYSTTDARKGFHHLQPMLECLVQQHQLADIELLVFGASESPLTFPPQVSVRYLGTIFDDAKLRLVYAAADVTVAPSLEDACAKVPIESMACGTPVVCFDATGMKDIVDHRENGYRARCYAAEDLARGVHWVLRQAGPLELAARCRQKVEHSFSLEQQTQKYLRLYAKLTR